MATSLSHISLCRGNRHDFVHSTANASKSSGPMALAAIPDTVSKPPESGWSAMLRQIDRHCATPKRIRADTENTKIRAANMSAAKVWTLAGLGGIGGKY